MSTAYSSLTLAVSVVSALSMPTANQSCQVEFTIYVKVRPCICRKNILKGKKRHAF